MKSLELCRQRRKYWLLRCLFVLYLDPIPNSIRCKISKILLYKLEEKDLSFIFRLGFSVVKLSRTLQSKTLPSLICQNFRIREN